MQPITKSSTVGRQRKVGSESNFVMMASNKIKVLFWDKIKAKWMTFVEERTEKGKSDNRF